MELREIWRTGGTAANGLIYPVELRFATQGLVVYDHGRRVVIVLDAATGKRRFEVGHHGTGPGGFTGRPVLLTGSATTPIAIEFATRRLSTLIGNSLESITVAGGGRWSSGCVWGSHLLLHQSGSREHDLYVATADKANRIVDSIANPFPVQASLPFIVRQGVLTQLSDAECLFLPLYHTEFAVLHHGRRPQIGKHIEAIPAAEAAVTRLSGGGTSSKVKRGAVRGGVAAAQWGNFVAILFQGTSRERRRVLDLYERATLRYAGSVRLPFVADRLHAAGDTLAIVGEHDDEPIIAAFLPSRKKAK